MLVHQVTSRETFLDVWLSVSEQRKVNQQSLTKKKRVRHFREDEKAKRSYFEITNSLNENLVVEQELESLA